MLLLSCSMGMGPAFSHPDDLYCLQTRPVVTLPPSCFFDLTVPGTAPTLWDNSNIVESYSGVTSPLTFSFASHAYEQVRREEEGCGIWAGLHIDSAVYMCVYR